MKPKITFLHFQVGRFGGAELYTLQSAQALQALGCKVNAISTLRANTDPVIVGVPHRGLLPHWKWIRWGYLKLLHRSGLQQFALNLALKRFASQTDIVVAAHFHLLAPVLRYAQRQGKKTWLVVYGIDIWRDWSVLETRDIEMCDDIIAISQFTADSVKRRLQISPERIHIIHPMVDTEKYTLSRRAPPAEPRIILTVGRLAANEAYKGHDLLIQALPGIIRRLRVPVEYHIVGEGNDQSRLASIVEHMGVTRHVKFLGRLEGDAFLNAYHNCHVFAMPSYVSQRPNGQWTGEGFGIVYAEAAACGKPVLACDEGGQVDVVRHTETGLLVKPTVQAVEEGLVRMLSDLEKAHQMGINGRKFVENHFAREHFYRKWAELARDL